MSAYLFPSIPVPEGTLNLLVYNNDGLPLVSGAATVVYDDVVINVAKLTQRVEVSGFGGEMQIDEFEIEVVDMVDPVGAGSPPGSYWIFSDGIFSFGTTAHDYTQPPPQVYAYLSLTDSSSNIHYAMYGNVALNDSPINSSFFFDLANGHPNQGKRTIKFKIQSLFRLLENYTVYDLRDWLGHNNHYLSQSSDDNRWLVKPIDVLTCIFEGISGTGASNSGLLGNIPTNNGVAVPNFSIDADTYLSQTYNDAHVSDVHWKDLWIFFGSPDMTLPATGNFAPFFDETTNYSFFKYTNLRDFLFGLCADIMAYPVLTYDDASNTLKLELRQRVNVTPSDQSTLGLALSRDQSKFYGYKAYGCQGNGESGINDFVAILANQASVLGSSVKTLLPQDFANVPNNVLSMSQLITINQERPDATVTPEHIDYRTADITGAHTVANVFDVASIHDPYILAGGGHTFSRMVDWRARYALRLFAQPNYQVTKKYSGTASIVDLRVLSRFYSTVSEYGFPTYPSHSPPNHADNGTYSIIEITDDFIENTKEITFVNYTL